MTLIYFILILGLTVFIHELGHFIFAKKSGVYCYEFSLGMGPKLFSFRRKNDEKTTVYSRLVMCSFTIRFNWIWIDRSYYKV